MNIVANNQRNCLPSSFQTKFYAVKRILESKWKSKKVCRFYHVKRQSLNRWIRKVLDVNLDYNLLKNYLISQNQFIQTLLPLMR